MHSLEHLLLLLSLRIEKETGNAELALAARRLSSASHDYISEGSADSLDAMSNDWLTKYGDLAK